MRAKLGLVREERRRRPVDRRSAGADGQGAGRLHAELPQSAAARIADWLALFGDSGGDAEAWLSRYRVRTESEDLCGTWTTINPKYVLRNWVAETAIRAVEDQGDIATLDRIFRLLQARLKSMTATKLSPRRRRRNCAGWK